MYLFEKRRYLAEIRDRYRDSSKREKSAILDEFCHVCGYNRTYAVRLLSKPPRPPRKRPGPKPRYRDEAFVEVLKRFWFVADQTCSDKLVIILRE